MFYSISQKSLSDMGVATYKELWDSVSKDNRGLSVELPVEITAKGEGEKRVYTMVASTEDEDRHGDVVLQNWDMEKYIPLIDSHQYGSISSLLGRYANPRVDGKKLKGELVFTKANPLAVMAEEMVEDKTVQKSSVGFIPKEFDAEGRISKAELLEVSLVAVPANPRAALEKAVESFDQEVKELKSTITDETPVEQVVETALQVDSKKFILNNIVKGIQDMEAQNLAEQKRQLLKAIRQL